MARAGRKDRGLFAKKDAAGRLRWFVRLWHERKDRQFGSFNSKTEARSFMKRLNRSSSWDSSFPNGTSGAGLPNWTRS